jgi:hypothetical protein
MLTFIMLIELRKYIKYSQDKFCFYIKYTTFKYVNFEIIIYKF